MTDVTGEWGPEQRSIRMEGRKEARAASDGVFQFQVSTTADSATARRITGHSLYLSNVWDSGKLGPPHSEPPPLRPPGLC